MTERLYYADPYRTSFTARVCMKLTCQDRPAVILDRTAFYPTSGGQPADRGTLGNATVLDVVEREPDSPGPRDVVHLLSEPIATDEVTGKVLWKRRFDHMQQHTGQHVLSAAFRQVMDAATVGFHLGARSTTIDVDVGDLEIEDVLPVETVANEVIWDDRRVCTRFAERDALADLPMTDARPDLEGPLRLVQIPGPSPDPSLPLSPATVPSPAFDLNPCAGTHVARTGEIGMVKIVRLEHRGDKTRVEFLCGARALRDYEAKRSATSALATMLTVGIGDLREAVDRLREENKQLRYSERELRRRLLDAESAQLVDRAALRGSYRVVAAVWRQRSPDELQALARRLAEHSDVVALLFSIRDRVHLCFARAETLDLDVNELLQVACARLGGRGGGRAQVAQGSAPGASREEVESVLRSLQVALEQRD